MGPSDSHGFAARAQRGRPAVDRMARARRHSKGMPSGRDCHQQQQAAQALGSKLGRAMWREKRRMRVACTQRRGYARGGGGGAKGVVGGIRSHQGVREERPDKLPKLIADHYRQVRFPRAPGRAESQPGVLSQSVNL